MAAGSKLLAVLGIGTLLVMGGCSGSGTSAPSPTQTPAAPSPPMLVGTSKSLPAGMVGTAYKATLSASGGTPPYAWTLSAGALAAGLALDATTGSISGTPTAAASGSLTFKVTDAGSPAQSASVTLAQSIAAAPAPTLSFSANPASVTAGGSSTLSWTATNAAGCIAGSGWSGTQPTSGSQTVTPTATTTYSLSCTGLGGTTAKSTTVTMVAAPGTFTLTNCPGDSATVMVNISANGTFAGTVNLAASGLPAGGTAQFSPPSINQSGSSTLTITVPAGTPRTSSTVSITGTSGSTTLTATAPVTVGCP